jgi:ribonucleotide monophosphatase NagD (HAD superfamily)
MDGTKVIRVESVHDAEAVLLLSMRPGDTYINHVNWLEEAAGRNLPIFCPSSDMLSVAASRVVSGMATVTNNYRSRGGTVINVGKPEQIFYAHCRHLLPGVSPAKILAIGDQVASDCDGALMAGMEAALVGTGAAMSTFQNCSSTPDLLTRVIERSRELKRPAPQWILPALQWTDHG